MIRHQRLFFRPTVPSRLPSLLFLFPDGVGPNKRRREMRGGGDDYSYYARVTAGYTMVAGRAVRWAEGCRGSGALHRWLQLCPQDDGGQAHDKKITLEKVGQTLSEALH